MIGASSFFEVSILFLAPLSDLVAIRVIREGSCYAAALNERFNAVQGFRYLLLDFFDLI